MSRIIKEATDGKDYHRTMGYADVPLDPPDNFLKVGCGVRADPVPRDHICPRRYLAPLPKWQSRRVQSAPPPNFKLRNIHAVVEAPTRRPSARFVDTRKGDFHDVHSSGLLPTYIYQPKFGHVPKYLLQRVKEISSERERVRREELSRQPKCRYVSLEERQGILHGLKHNWQELQRTFQGLSLLTDTVNKRMRKIKIESQLKQLEKDIFLVESNQHIYVCDEDDVNSNTIQNRAKCLSS